MVKLLLASANQEPSFQDIKFRVHIQKFSRKETLYFSYKEHSTSTQSSVQSKAVTAIIIIIAREH